MKKALFLTLILLTNISFSQQEKIIISLNSQTFVTGEKIFYSVNLFNKVNNKNISKIVYVELYDKKNDPVFKHKIFLENNTGEGYFFINPNVKTGKYALVSYTNLILNDVAPEIITKEITIINPYKENINNIFKMDNQKISTLDSISNIPIFNKREKIEIKKIIKNFPEAKNYSISIKLKNNITYENENSSINLKKDTIKSFQIIDEKIGNVISGVVTSNSKPVNNISVGINCECETPYIETVQTDSKGNFHFTFQKPIPTNKIKVFVIGSDSKSFSIQFDEFNFNTKYLIKLNDSITLQKNYKQEIEKIAFATQIENAYSDLKKDTIIKQEKNYLINPKLYKTYNLSDFTRFSSLKETIIEIINEMYYTDKDGDFKIHLRNYKGNIEMKELPLIFVNEYIILNQNDLLKLDIAKIKTIKFINQQYFFGDKIYGGVIEMTSEENLNFTSEQFTYKNITNYLPSIKLFSPEYPDELLERIPDYRTQLYWKTNVEKANFEDLNIFTSDLEGIYEVKVFGLTKDGDYFSSRNYFQVK